MELSVANASAGRPGAVIGPRACELMAGDVFGEAALAVDLEAASADAAAGAAAAAHSRTPAAALQTEVCVFV